MKKQKKKQTIKLAEEHESVVEEISNNIIYRLSEEGITHLDAGWAKFELLLSDNITFRGDMCDGLTEFDKYTIKINMHLTNEQGFETLLHEIMHVAFETVGLGGSEEDLPLTMKNEEATAQVTRGLMLLKNLNSRMFELLFERGEE